MVTLLELKCQSSKADCIFKMIGFQVLECVEGSALGGGIWIGGHLNLGVVDIVKEHNPFIHLKLS